MEIMNKVNNKPIRIGRNFIKVELTIQQQSFREQSNLGGLLTRTHRPLSRRIHFDLKNQIKNAVT